MCVVVAWLGPVSPAGAWWVGWGGGGGFACAAVAVGAGWDAAGGVGGYEACAYAV
jgi:hypothetical protein